MTRLLKLIFTLVLGLLSITTFAARPVGIDSDFNCCSVEWATVAANGVQFACIKATAQDSGFKNSVFAARMRGAQAAGLYTIAYNRVNPSSYTPSSEAAYFWDFARNCLTAYGFSLSPAIDVEDGLTGSYKKDGGGTQTLAAWCNQYFTDLSALASAAGLHIKQLTYVNVGSTCTIGSGLHGNLWLADPCGCNAQTGSPYTCGGCSVSGQWDGCEPIGSESWSIWQYEWSSQESAPPFPGLSERVDINTYDGTLAQMVSALGTTGTKAAPVDDFDGDGAPDAVLFRPTNANWYIRHSSDASTQQFAFGATGDIPLLGGVGGSDFDGDGVPDAVVFRPSNANWYIRHSSDASIQQFAFGATGDIPFLGGDFDGDGVPETVVFRPSTSTWYVRYSGDGSSHSFVWGTTGDIPLIGGDFEGDGVPDAVTFRPSNGNWYVRYSSTGADHQFQFGTNGDIPLLGGDFDGDGVPDAVIFRPSKGNWYIRHSTDGSSVQFQFGTNGDVPLLGGDFDGDGIPDAIIYRPSNGGWYIRYSSTGATHSFTWGTAGDIAVH